MGTKQSKVTIPTGAPQVLQIDEASVQIHSDFNQTGQVDFSSDERNARLQRPGSILLPIFNPDLVSDEYMTPVYVRPWAERPPRRDDELVLQFKQDEDTRRVVGYEAETRQQVLGPRPRSPEIRKKVKTKVPASSPNWQKHYQMHAVTLAGDPGRSGPVDQSPPQIPENTPADRKPGEVWVQLRHRKSALSKWKDDHALFLIAPFLLQSNLEPVHRLYVVSSKDTHNFVYDVMEACWRAFGGEGEFPRASHRLFSPSTPEERDAGKGCVHTVDADGNPLLSPDKMYLIDGAQYPDVWIQDQMEIGYCSAPGGRAFNVVLDCKRQASGPQKNLGHFLDEQIDSLEDRMFVYNGISGSASSTDFGGNIAVSPPVSKETDSHNDRRAGPPVPKHPAAPHGKIILGDCYNPNRQGRGAVHHETRDFLQAQGMQPIIPIDTSWLRVGHVDEIMTFVPGRDCPKLGMARPDVMKSLLNRTRSVPVENGRTHFHRGRYRDLDSLFEHSDLSGEQRNLGSLSSELRAEHRNPEYQRILNTLQNEWTGREYRKADVRRKIASSYDEVTVEQVLSRTENNEIYDRFLKPIEDRLCHCTDLDRPTDVLPLPVYFKCVSPSNVQNPKWGTKGATACTPNVVNMQVLNTERETHLLVPRPCGPRLPTMEARSIVQEVLRDIGWGGTTVPTPETGSGKPGFPFWAWPDLHFNTLSLFFTYKKPNGNFLTADERDRIIRVIKGQSRLPDLDRSLWQAVGDTEQTILTANPDAREFLNQERRFTEWYRLFIPEETVDVIELYTRSVLEKIGCHVHFIDAWFYHIGQGNVHCATNVLHRPSTAESLRQNGRQPWWEHYPDLNAEDVNTTYDPRDTAHQ